MWGIGTKLYGYDNFDPETKSYISTKWFMIFYIPIFPLASYRVWDIKEEKTKFSVFPPGMESSAEYRMMRVKLAWRQILKTFALACLLWIPLVLALIFSNAFD